MKVVMIANAIIGGKNGKTYSKGEVLEIDDNVYANIKRSCLTDAQVKGGIDSLNVKPAKVVSKGAPKKAEDK